MPPAIPVATVAAVAGAQAFTFTTPATTKVRDSVLLVLATDSTNGPDLTAASSSGWSQLGSFTSGASKIWLLRREALLEDTGNVSIPFLAALAWGIGAALVYRNLNTGAALVGSSSTAIAASTNFVCPAQVLGQYSDLYLGIVLVTSAATAVAPPAGCTERIEVQTGGRTLEVFDVLAEATGTTGTKTATTGAAQTGIAASAALSADAIVGYGLQFSFDPIGAIGLPSKGV